MNVLSDKMVVEPEEALLSGEALREKRVVDAQWERKAREVKVQVVVSSGCTLNALPARVLDQVRVTQ